MRSRRRKRVNRRTTSRTKSRRKVTKRSQRVWPRGGVPTVADIKRDIWAEVIPAAYARDRQKAAAAVRVLLRLADRLDLLALFHAKKRSGRPVGPDTRRDALRVLVWGARRRYRIPSVAIENVVGRDPKWVRTRVRQTDALIASGMFEPARVFALYDALPPPVRKERILAKIATLARTAR